MDEQYADILHSCLARLEAGATVEECLAAFPTDRTAIEGPLRTAVRLQQQAGPAMPAPSRAAIQSRLRSQVAISRTGSAPAAASSPVRTAPPRAGFRSPLRPPARRLAAIGLAVVLALVLGAGALAAVRAVIQAIAPVTTAIPTAPPVESFTLSGPIQQIAPDGWVVADLLVVIDAATVISGTPVVGADATVRAVLRDDGSLLARAITVTTPAPTTEPPLVPTAAPPPTAASTSAPPTAPTVPPVPPAPATAFAGLRALIEAGIADRHVQRADGTFLLEQLRAAEEAVADDKAANLRDRLRDMQQKTREQVGAGTIDAAFGQQVLDAIAAIANTYNIQVSDDVDEDKDKDKDKDKDEDKDKDKDS